MNETKQTVALEIQLNRKYASHWRHLNPSHYLGDVEIVDRLVGQRDDYGSHDVILRVKFVPFKDKNYRADNIIRALNDTFSHHGCDHEHDCCGCASISAEAMIWPLSQDNEYMVTEHVSYNY